MRPVTLRTDLDSVELPFAAAISVGTNSCRSNQLCAFPGRGGDLESITFLDAMHEKIEVKHIDLQILPSQMQRHGYYASLQGPWLVCSTSKRQHDSMLFAAQAAQVLADANMAVVPVRTARRTESSLAA